MFVRKHGGFGSLVGLGTARCVRRVPFPARLVVHRLGECVLGPLSFYPFPLVFHRVRQSVSPRFLFSFCRPTMRPRVRIAGRPRRVPVPSSAQVSSTKGASDGFSSGLRPYPAVGDDVSGVLRVWQLGSCHCRVRPEVGIQRAADRLADSRRCHRGDYLPAVCGADCGPILRGPADALCAAHLWRRVSYRHRDFRPASCRW